MITLGPESHCLWATLPGDSLPFYTGQLTLAWRQRSKQTYLLLDDKWAQNPVREKQRKQALHVGGELPLGRAKGWEQLFLLLHTCSLTNIRQRGGLVKPRKIKQVGPQLGRGVLIRVGVLK